MTNLEKIEANERKNQRMKSENFYCSKCNKKFGNSQLQLAHIIEASKKNIEKFGRLVMYHHDMMVLTCSNCNSSVLKNRASNPIEAYEKIIDILSLIIIDDPCIFDYGQLLKAFDNVDKDKIVSVVSIAQYNILENFFIKYREI